MGNYSLGTMLQGPASECAPRLLGCIMERHINGQVIRARIVETEAYDQGDVASHSYKGRTPRTEVMFGQPGRLYVYFTYGMHYCCNVVVGQEHYGAAVLIRAVEPLSGVSEMEKNRLRPVSIRELSNGPAKLCQALLIDRKLNGHDLSLPPIKLVVCPELKKEDIIQTTRVGISRGKDLPWRFYIKNNDFVSKPWLKHAQ